VDRAEIQKEYEKRVAACPKTNWGWSFMYTPEAALKRAKAVLVGLNPGGRQTDPPNEWEYTDGVNAYVDESWNCRPKGEHPLQKQVSALFKAINVEPADIFAANFVPFRSPGWRDLPDRNGALTFARMLWSDLVLRTSARLYCSLGKQAGEEIATLLNAAYVDSEKVGWGAQTIDTYRNCQGLTVLALPHLSRYRLFSGRRSDAAEVCRNAADLVLATAGTSTGPSLGLRC
jgi:hypothetical protein